MARRRRATARSMMPRGRAAHAAGAAPDAGPHLRRASLGGHVPRAARERSPRPRSAAAHRRRQPPRARRCRSGSRETEALLLLLDYDGTLVPFTATPELARPDPRLLELLCARWPRGRDTEVHVVSGRPAETLEHWLGDLPICAPRRARLLVSRDPADSEWIAGGGARRELARAGAGHAPGDHRSGRPARWSRSSRPRWRGTTAWPTRRPAPAAPTSSGCT